MNDEHELKVERYEMVVVVVVVPFHLPEGEEDNRLDEDEFEQRVEGC